MKKIALIILIIHLFTLSVTNICMAQSKPIYNSIDSLLSAYQTEDMPGGAIAIVSKDGAIYTKCFGVMNTITLEKINQSTLFDLASVAKQFTAYAILLLEDQGKIDLDCDIREYIKDLPNYKHTITVRNLLQHTSGIASTDWLRLASNLDFEGADLILQVAACGQLQYD